MSILLAVLPIFLLIAAGFILREIGVVKSVWIRVINGFVYYVALPALIIQSIAQLGKSTGIVSLLFYSISVLVAVSVVLLLLVRWLPLHNKDKSTVFVASVVPNSVYLGVPLVTRLLEQQEMEFSTEKLVLVSVIFLVGGMLMALSALEFVFIGTKNAKGVFHKLAKNPLILAIIIGIVLAPLGWPHWLEDSVGVPLKMLALTASPLALFVLGSFLYGKSLAHKKVLIFYVVVLRLVIAPITAFFVLKILASDIPNFELEPIMLMSAMPTAVTAFVLSEAYHLNKTTTAAAMLATTVVAIGSVSALSVLL